MVVTAAAAKTKIGCNYETVGRRAKRSKIWAPGYKYVLLNISTFIVYGIGFAMVVTTAAATATTKNGRNSETVARRAKRTTIWAPWAVVHTTEHIHFHRLWHWFRHGRHRRHRHN